MSYENLSFSPNWLVSINFWWNFFVLIKTFWVAPCNTNLQFKRTGSWRRLGKVAAVRFSSFFIWRSRWNLAVLFVSGSLLLIQVVFPIFFATLSVTLCLSSFTFVWFVSRFARPSFLLEDSNRSLQAAASLFLAYHSPGKKWFQASSAGKRIITKYP